jgi:hypothetical protein
MALTQLVQSDEHKGYLILLRLIELNSSLSTLMINMDSNETIRTDNVINVFRTFSQLNKFPIITQLNVSSLEDYTQNTISAGIDSEANFILFPVSAGSAFPKGSLASIGFELFQSCHLPVGLLVDRGFGISSQKNMDEASSPTLNDNLQSIIMIYHGGNDDYECLNYISRMVPSNIDIKILQLAETETTIELKTMIINANVSLTETDPSQLITWFDQYGKNDLIVVGYDAYTANEELRDWFESTCPCSILIVGKNDKPKIVELEIDVKV